MQLAEARDRQRRDVQAQRRHHAQADMAAADVADVADRFLQRSQALDDLADFHEQRMRLVGGDQAPAHQGEQGKAELRLGVVQDLARSEEHTSELQSLMRISYAVFGLKKKTNVDLPQPKLTHKSHSTTNNSNN